MWLHTKCCRWGRRWGVGLPRLWATGKSGGSVSVSLLPLSCLYRPPFSFACFALRLFISCGTKQTHLLHCFCAIFPVSISFSSGLLTEKLAHCAAWHAKQAFSCCFSFRFLCFAYAFLFVFFFFLLPARWFFSPFAFCFCCCHCQLATRLPRFTGPACPRGPLSFFSPPAPTTSPVSQPACYSWLLLFGLLMSMPHSTPQISFIFEIPCNIVRGNA